jgi:hypothetical protein
LAFAARQCTQGACLPAKTRAEYIPVPIGIATVTETVYDILIMKPILFTGNRAARDVELVVQHEDNLGASSGGMETTRIEQTRGKLKSVIVLE